MNGMNMGSGIKKKKKKGMSLAKAIKVPKMGKPAMMGGVTVPKKAKKKRIKKNPGDTFTMYN